MEKTVVIHQPDFLPHIAFFHRFLHADLWVALDHVQFTRKTSRSWQNRDKIKSRSGQKWITIAVQKCAIDTPVNEVMLSREKNWKEDHLNMLKENYKKADHFDEIFPYIQQLYDLDCEKMVDFNLASIAMLMKLFDIKIPVKMSSSMGPVGRKNELLIDILKKSGAASYLSGTGARDYLEERLFKDANIKVIWQDFKHPEYKQLHGDFIPYLSSVDILFNCGIEESRKIIRGC